MLVTSSFVCHSQIVSHLKEQIRRNHNSSLDIQRFEVILEPLELLPWLERQKLSWKFYWSSAEYDRGIEVAALGIARELVFDSTIPLSEIRYYGMAGFSDQHLKLILPRIEIIPTGEYMTLSCYIVKEDGQDLSRVFAELDTLSFQDKFFESTVPSMVKREDCPHFSQWVEGIEKALSYLSRGDLEKIVLARKVHLLFSDDLPPFHLLNRLMSKIQKCFYFCFSPEMGKAFISSSPEMLYRRQGRKIQSEAIAGTRPRGKSFESDKALEAELLSSEKDFREHRYVVEHIHEAFRHLCSEVYQEGERTLLKRDCWQHLCQAIGGKLLPNITDSQVVRSLHPTPAVGGVPKEKAKTIIREIEGFDRDYYCGVVGWLSKDFAEFSVAIRSGVICHNRLTLYSGAGIVNGSDPLEEWKETEIKLSNFLMLVQP